LRSLTISANLLGALPAELAIVCPKLTQLDVSQNDLKALPQSLSRCAAVHLIAGSAHRSRLLACFGRLHHVQRIFAHCNYISALPEGAHISVLRRAACLLNCWLRAGCDESWTVLANVNLANNCFDQFPAALQRLASRQPSALRFIGLYSICVLKCVLTNCLV
jgi:hypothetical protein